MHGFLSLSRYGDVWAPVRGPDDGIVPPSFNMVANVTFDKGTNNFLLQSNLIGVCPEMASEFSFSEINLANWANFPNLAKMFGFTPSTSN